MRSVLRGRDFRLLWIGQGVSLLGDQFYLIALPWLVLRLTGDPLSMGTVLAVAGIPRALFMLVGGALTDRFSPRTLMLASDVLRLIVVSLLAAVVFAGRVQSWMLYAFALTFGLVDAFFYPAQIAMVPRLVDAESLQAGNSLIQGTAQLSLFAGPVLAGLMIALLEGTGPYGMGAAGSAPGMKGIAIAFGFDAFTFLVSTVTLWMMTATGKATGDIAPEAASAASVLASVREGLLAVWNDTVLRTFFALLAAINLLVAGPLGIGIPVLADRRFPEGAAAFGMIMSAYGAGSLLGTGLAGVLPKPAPRVLGMIVLLDVGVLGIGMALLGLASSTLIAAAITLMMGIVDGYAVILFITWLQVRTPANMLGRMMSLLMFAAVGLKPLSDAVAGVLIGLNVTWVFVGAGAVVTLMVLASALHPLVRTMGVED